MAIVELESGGLSRRDQAVVRSLDSARLRAESRVQRFLDAASELLASRAGKDFTVHEVVELSGQSLHTFYQYFEGKHELFLALIEESVRTSAEHLRAVIAEQDEPLERLHRFVVEYHSICRSGAPSGGEAKRKVLLDIAEFAQQLLTEHPTEAALVFSPLVSLFEELFEQSVAVGSVRSGLHSGSVVGIIMEVIMFNSFSATIAGLSLRHSERDSAEDLWNLILNGIGTGTSI